MKLKMRRYCVCGHLEHDHKPDKRCRWCECNELHIKDEKSLKIVSHLPILEGYTH